MFLGLVQNLSDNQIRPLLQLNKHWALTKNNDHISLLSNVCPHQNSLLAKKVCSDVMVCPYHGLRFDSMGTGLDNSYQLETKPVYTVGNMLFSEQIEFDYPIDLSFMQLVECRVDSLKTSPEIFIDVFLDIEHIPVVHRGVYDKIGITDVSTIRTEFFDCGSHQFVQDQDAVWTTIYPNTTIEWQQGALFVNVAVATATGTDVVIYKYRDSRISDAEWVLNETVWEEAWAQDKELCENIVAVPVNNLSDLKLHHLNAIKK